MNRTFCGSVIAGLALLGVACDGSERSTEERSSTAKSRQAIIGGDVVTDITPYPGVGALVYRNANDDAFFFCGGVLIAPRWVVTAAHCFGPATAGSAVSGGEVCLTNPAVCEVEFGGVSWPEVAAGAVGQSVRFEQVYRHEGFTGDLHHDIALIELTEAVDPAVTRPAAILTPFHLSGLNATTPDEQGTVLLPIGWGAIATSGPQLEPANRIDTFDVLLRKPHFEEDTTYFGDHVYCRANSDWAAPFLPTDTHFCAASTFFSDHDPDTDQTFVTGSDPLPETSAGPCRGDSGGPIYYDLPGEGNVLAGVTSGAAGCALERYPAWYTRVGDYLADFGVANASPFGLPEPIVGVRRTVDIPPSRSDLVLVLDRSGSMSARDFEAEGNGITRLEVAAEGAKYLAASLDPNDDHRVAIVSYSSTSSQNLGFVSRSDADALTRIDSAVSGIVEDGPSGTTSIGSGLNRALGLLEAVPSEADRRPAVFLLTDGRQNRAPCLGVDDGSGVFATGDCEPTVGDPADPILNTDSRLSGTPVCSIGMGRAQGQVDERILEAFSTKYVDASATSSQVVSDLSRFAKCVPSFSNDGIGVDPVGVLARDRVAAAPFSYDSASDLKLTFLSSWSARVDSPGDMRLFVNRPNGDLLVPASERELTLERHFHVQRDRSPAPGRWRVQIARDTNRFLNGFTTNAFTDAGQGVEIVRRQIQRLCPDGCSKALYFEDGRRSLSRPSVYRLALDAEGPAGSGLIDGIVSFNAGSASGFTSALNAADFQLVVYAHQMTSNVEPYDDALRNVLCNTTTPAIITDTRVAGSNQTAATRAQQFHVCSGGVTTRRGTNYADVTGHEGTLFDGVAFLSNPGYETFSYSIAPAPFDALATSSDFAQLAHVGATQLEGSDGSFFSETTGGIPVFYGSIVSFSADRPYENIDVSPRARNLQRWSAEVHFSGFAPIEPVPVPAPAGGGLTLAVRTRLFAPPGGIRAARVRAEVTSPTADLADLLEASTCTGPASVAGDAIPGPATAVTADDVPVRVDTFVLNDQGTNGDSRASDSVWSRRVPALGQITGTYEIRYFAEFDYVDHGGVQRTLFREEFATQYVGEEVVANSASCPPPKAGTVVFVDANATGTGSGTSWENAFRDLQAGIDAAKKGMQVWVKEGTYAGRVYLLHEGVGVYGGFDTALIGVAGSIATRNLSRDVSILDGETVRALAVLGENSHLDGFSIRNGKVASGGIVFADSVQASIANCRFQNNSPIQAASLLHAVNSTLSVNNCVFEGNSLIGQGGAAHNIVSNVTYTNSTFTDTVLFNGASMHNDFSNVSVSNCTFAGGTLTNWAGAVRNWYSTLTVANSILWREVPFWVPQIDNLFGFVDVTYSDVRGGWTGQGNINRTPRFVNAPFDLRLASGSPCIDASDSRKGPTQDISGLPRRDDPAQPNTGAGPVTYVDMGAHERQP